MAELGFIAGVQIGASASSVQGEVRIGLLAFAVFGLTSIGQKLAVLVGEAAESGGRAATSVPWSSNACSVIATLSIDAARGDLGREISAGSES